ncbi:hypothetical protein A4A49_10430 [Nicotiana attenuata]|uniref:Uncharacterized protein n=1 Tax=Nicotiana attenuata TaxID=49451 RepID=A0A1J6IW31_NICAT|nr:hypothetical protein A4A49_10430 [Nicotiana attenuata]
MSSSQESPSIAPDGFSGKDDRLLFSGDHNFALHGQIMLFVLVLLFTIFLLSMILMLYMKHFHPNCNAKSNRSSSPLEEDFPSAYPPIFPIKYAGISPSVWVKFCPLR